MFCRILEREQEEIIHDRFCYEWKTIPVVSFHD